MIALRMLEKHSLLYDRLAFWKKTTPAPRQERHKSLFPSLLKPLHPLTEPSLGPLLGRIGSLEVRLVTSRSQLRAAQRLRYRVFYKEMSARRKIIHLARGRDVDPFDAYCDHLIVVDNAAKPDRFMGERAKIVGTYRLLRQEIAERYRGFYSESEYVLDTLLGRHKERRFLELGRSCVMEEYRTKRTVELLWHGIWTYVLHHKIDVMFGCASLEGTNLSALDEQLSLLCELGAPPPQWQVRARAEHYVPMGNRAADFSRKRALGALPPLIKGYLRLGAYISDGAVVDHAFGTTDVLIILPVENINPRYVSHYGENAGRYAA